MLGRLFKSLRNLFSTTSNKVILIAILIFFVPFLGQFGFEFSGANSHIRRFEFLFSPDASIFSMFERLEYDRKIIKRGYRDPGDHVVIVGIGERSMAQLGRFPFHRRIFADLLKKLEASEVKVVAFDILFSEKEEGEALHELQALKSSIPEKILKTPIGQSFSKEIDKRMALTDDDELLAQAIDSNLLIVFGYFFNRFSYNYFVEDKKVDLALERSEKQKFDQQLRENLLKQHYTNISTTRDMEVSAGCDSQCVMKNLGWIMLTPLDPILPIPTLFKYSKSRGNVSFGFFDSLLDGDGIYRRAPTVAFYDGRVYPSIAAKAAGFYIGGLKGKLRGSADTINGVRVRVFGRDTNLPVDSKGRMWINFAGNTGSIRNLELVDVLPVEAGGTGKYGKAELKGKLVFVGTLASALKDNKSVPLSGDFPGVEVNANIANSIITQDYLVKGEVYFWVGFFLLSFGAILFGKLVARLNPVVSTIGTIALLTAFYHFDQNYFFERGLIIPWVIPSMQYMFILFGIVIHKFVSADKDKKFVETAFSRFVSGSVAKQVLQDHGSLRMGSQNKELTVLFTDIKNFTELSEQLEADVLSEYLKDFFTDLTGKILDNRGTLDKYIGDAVMCFWGAPLHEEFHAIQACTTALEMQDSVRNINDRWQERLRFETVLRIGVNSGVMAVGNMGSEQIFDYTVLGDNVNLGSRLEGINKVYSTQIIVSEGTYNECKGHFLFRKIDCVQVVGKDIPVNIYELLAKSSEDLADKREWVDSYHNALAAYQKREWDEAERVFKLCIELNSKDGASKEFLERIEGFRQQAPDDEWQAVWKISSK